MRMNSGEALHISELRTIPQQHLAYCFICREMWRKIQKVHPALAEAGNSSIGRSTVWDGGSRRCGRSLKVGARKPRVDERCGRLMVSRLTAGQFCRQRLRNPICIAVRVRVCSGLWLTGIRIPSFHIINLLRGADVDSTVANLRN